MATGDTPDFVRRLRGLMPQGWFPAPPALGQPETAPVLVGILTGLASQWSYVWSLLSYVGLQSRLATTTGSNLELTAQDYFGAGAFPRLTGETDAAYITRIMAARLPNRGTRPALTAALASLTGAAPTILEPRNATDTKGWGSTAVPAGGGGYGYGVAGGMRYGSRLRQFEAVVDVQGGTAVATSTTYSAIVSNLPVATIAWTNPDAS